MVRHLGETQFLGKDTMPLAEELSLYTLSERGVFPDPQNGVPEGSAGGDHAAVRGQPQVSFGPLEPPASSYSGPCSFGLQLFGPFQLASLPLGHIPFACRSFASVPQGLGGPIRCQIQSMCLIRKATGFGAKAESLTKCPSLRGASAHLPSLRRS